MDGRLIESGQSANFLWIAHFTVVHRCVQFDSLGCLVFAAVFCDLSCPRFAQSVPAAKSQVWPAPVRNVGYIRRTPGVSLSQLSTRVPRYLTCWPAEFSRTRRSNRIGSSAPLTADQPQRITNPNVFVPSASSSRYHRPSPTFAGGVAGREPAGNMENAVFLWLLRGQRYAALDRHHGYRDRSTQWRLH